MVWTLMALFAAAALAPLAIRFASGRGWLILAAVPVACMSYFAARLPMSAGERLSESYAWFPALGVELVLVLDGLSLLFALLITGIGALVIIYAAGYLGSDPRRARFFGYLLLFMGAMLGLVLSDNLVALFVFWELTSVSSYLLIGYKHEQQEARDAALKALLVTAAGGLALLLAFLLLASAAGEAGLTASQATSISALSAIDLRGHALYTPAVVLLLLGAFTKSAQMPWHFWLPAAMVAPTPASAYLHSATMVKAGVYLVARMNPALGDTKLWTLTLFGVGATTMVLAAFMALGERDLKRILAQSTIAVLGFLMMLLGLGTPAAVQAAVVVLVAHAGYKAALFMIAGNVDIRAGSRDINALGGLRQAMPLTSMAAFLAAASMAGVPPFVGFIAKDLVYAGQLGNGAAGLLVLAVAFAASAMLVAVALMVLKPFLGARIAARRPTEASAAKLIGPLTLAGLGLFAGLVPQLMSDGVGAAAASAVLGVSTDMPLALWHGFAPEALAAIALSVMTLATGVVIYRHLVRRAKAAEAPVAPDDPNGDNERIADRAYARALNGLYAGAGRFARVLQNGLLDRYLIVVLLTAVAAVMIPLLSTLAGDLAIPHVSLQFPELLLAGLVALGAITAAVLHSRFGAIVALGSSGVGMALFFALYGAPDLALTLIVVEVLTVVVLALVFSHLPLPVASESRRRTLRDGLVALVVGALMTGVCLAAAAIHLPADSASFYAENSVSAGKGRNVVNVILVDFRALDTLGETIVVAIAGLGVLSLLRVRAGTRRSRTEQLGAKEADS